MNGVLIVPRRRLSLGLVGSLILLLHQGSLATQADAASEKKQESLKKLAKHPSKAPAWFWDEVKEVERAQALHTVAGALREQSGSKKYDANHLSGEARKLWADMEKSRTALPPERKVPMQNFKMQRPSDPDAWALPPPSLKIETEDAPVAFSMLVLNAPLSQPEPADTQPTVDAQATDSIIVAKAHALGKDPIRIYNFVHDTIFTEIYYGSKKGALGTLREGRGNDIDQASLLIALLRASNIPARYEVGTIELTAAAANTYAASESLSATLTALSMAGIKFKTVSLGPGKGIGVQMAHTWVRAFLPVTSYRGIRESTGQDSWAYLGPSIKRANFQKAVDLRDAVTFDFQGYLSKPTAERPVDVYQRQIREYIQTHGINCETLGSAIKQQILVTDRLPLLPADLAGRRVATEAVRAELPSTVRHMVKFNGTSSQGKAFVYSAPMVSLWGKGISLVYEAATPLDATKIASYGGLESTPAYAIRLKAVLKVDAIAVASGESDIPGAMQTMRIDLQAPGGPSQSPIHSMTVAGIYAFALDPGLIPADLITERQARFANLSGDDLEAEKLYVSTLSYLRDLGLARQRIADLQWHRIIKNVEEAQAGIKPRMASYGATPVRLARDFFTFDAPSSLFATYAINGDHRRRNYILKLSGYEGSFLEHRIGEQFRGEKNYSAINLVQLAGSNVITLTAGNLDEALIQIHASGEVEEILRDAVGQGYTIIAPLAPIEVAGLGTLYGFIGLSNDSGMYKVVFQGQPLNGGVSLNGAPPAAGGAGAPQCGSCGGTGPGPSQVNLLSGNYFDHIAELSLPAKGLPLSFILAYSAQLGWHHSYDRRIDRKADGSLVFTDGEGVQWPFSSGSASGVWDPPPTKYQRIEMVPGGGYVMIYPDGIVHSFDGQGRLASETDTNGHQVTLRYGPDGRIAQVQGVGGGSMSFTHALGKLTEVNDSAGRTLRFTYDSSGNLVTYRDVLGHERKFTYHPSGKMRTKSDFRGNVTKIDYDDLGRAVRMEDAEGGVYKYAYDTRNRRVVYTDRLGNAKLYEVGTLGLPTRIVDALGNETLFQYDSYGNRVAERDARGLWSTSTYENGLLRSHTDALNHTTSYSYAALARLETVTDATLKVVTRNTYNSSGNLIRSQDALGNTTEYTYEDGLPIAIARPGDSVTRMTYDAAGNVKSMTDPTNGITTMTFNSAGHMVGIIDADQHARTMVIDAKGRMLSMTDSQEGVSSFTYDDDGNRLTVAAPGGVITRYTYDKLGRLLTTTDALGQVTSQEFDAEGRVVSRKDARGFVTRTQYDAIGRTISSTDPNGATTTMGYCANEASQPCQVVDSLGNVTTVIEDNLGREIERHDPLGNISRTEYDSLGRRRSVIDPAGKATTFGYDDAGRLISVTDAKQGVTRYGYDERGNRTSVTDANGHTTWFEYDLGNRLGAEVVPDGIMRTEYLYSAGGNRTGKLDGKQQTMGFTYDPNRRLTDIHYASGAPAHFEYDERGNRILERNGDSERYLAYDSLGRVTRVQDVKVGHTIEYTYDANGNRASMTVTPENETTRYVWDSRGLLAALTDPDGGNYHFAYDASGRRITTTYPNGMVLNTVYDTGSRIVSMIYKKKSGAVIESFKYTYDNRGNRISKIFADGKAELYDYDELSRLVRVVYPSGRTVQYVYDAVGNRTEMAESEIGAESTLPNCLDDMDCDGIKDALDNCPDLANPGQEDSDRGDIPQGLRYGFRFEEPSGNIVQDVNKAIQGTITSGVTRINGNYGKGLYFPGDKTASVIVPHSPAVDITGQEITISVWLLNGNMPGPIVSKPGQYGLWYTNPGVKFYYSGNMFLYGSADIVLSTYNKWNHVAITFNGSVIKAYLNGTLVSSKASSGQINSFPTPLISGCFHFNTDTSAGAKCLGSTFGFRGDIDDLGVWDRVLSRDEIVSLYRSALVNEDGKGDACDACALSLDISCAPTTCLDKDGDGYGLSGASACSAGQVEKFDCNDGDPNVHPGALENCDQVDNDCDGIVDDHCMAGPKVTQYRYNSFNQLLVSGSPKQCAAADSDCDGVADGADNCPATYNPGQEDGDKSMANPIGQGAVGIWGFEEATGSLVKDGVGGHDGTLLNGATLGTGKFGKGLVLDGVNDRVTVGNVNRPTGAFSFETWANLATIIGDPTLLDFGTNQPLMDTYKGLRVFPSGEAFGTVPTGRWVHLAYSWDNTTGRYYIDGNQVGQTTNSPGTGGIGLTIGSRKSGIYPVSGIMDDVAVWPRALTASEIKQHSQNSLVGDGLGDACDPCLGNPDGACRPTTCVDEDGDGYGIQGASNCAAGHPEKFDCDDHNNKVYPGSMEIALDGLDNDCNGSVDNLPQDVVTYTWDGNGNLLKKGDTTYIWDARDRLVSTSGGGAYGYDTSNLRTKMGEQKVLLDGIEEAREYGASEVRYDHDPSRVDGLLAQKAGGVKGYFVTDALGSVYAVVDASGTVVSKYGYDVYGARTATTEGMATGWGFTGRRHDGAGEMYYRARYLDEGMGVFTQTDPTGMVDGPNTYSYVRGRPSVANDPLGLFGLFGVKGNCEGMPGGRTLLVAELLQTYTTDIPLLQGIAFMYTDPRNPTFPSRFSYLDRGLRKSLYTEWDCDCSDAGPRIALTRFDDSQRTTRLYRGYFYGDSVKRSAVRAHELAHALLLGRPDEEMAIILEQRDWWTRDLTYLRTNLTNAASTIAGAYVGGWAGQHFPEGFSAWAQILWE